MKNTKIQRTNRELIEALRAQLHILADAINKTKAGDFAYAKVIAASLRVLVIKTVKNKPLLINLARRSNFPLIIKRDVPSFKASTITLGDMLNDLFFASNTERVKLTNRELIAKSAQQEGLSHEDFGLDMDYLTSKGRGLLIGGYPPYILALMKLGEHVHQVGLNLLTVVGEKE